MGDEMIEKMKTITYRDAEYKVPNWVHWVATDDNGCICGYEFEPEYFSDEHEWSVLGRHLTISAPIFWRDSLESV